MSLENIKLPFLAISDLPNKFRVAVCGNSREETKFTKEGQTQLVIHVILENKDEQVPIKNSPADSFLALSNHAQKSIRKKGPIHLDEIKGMIATFQKVLIPGYTSKTIEVTKLEAW